MLHRLHELAVERKDFAFETTLASRSYAKWLKELQLEGYRFSLIFLWLRHVELAIARVAARVKLGGHTIPEDTVRRRFLRGRTNFFEIYLPLADAWQMYNAGTEPPTEIARFDAVNGEIILDPQLWTVIKK